MQWLMDNKEWVFSGIGIFVISVIVGVVTKKQPTSTQAQKSGAHSTNFQAGGDMKVGNVDD